MHCFNAVPAQRGTDLSVEQQLDICNQIIDTNIKSVQLTGGEILLANSWIEVASKLIQSGIRVSIITNGTMLNEAVIEEISKTGISAIGFSIEGLQHNNDIIRGQGTYNKIMHAIELIYQCNPNLPISVNTTINRHNITDLKQLANELHHRHVTSWMVQLAVPDGNFKEHKNDFMIHPSQMDEIIDVMHQIWRQVPMNIFLGDCIGHFNRKEIEIRSTYSKAYGLKSHTEGCGAGKYVMGIKANGDMVGCISLKDKRYVEGNLKDIKLKDVIDNPDSFAWNREIKTKQQLIGDCAICQFGNICKSGCPALKYDEHYQLVENIYCSYNYAIKRERERIRNIRDIDVLTKCYVEAKEGEDHQLAGLYFDQLQYIKPYSEKNVKN